MFTCSQGYHMEVLRLDPHGLPSVILNRIKKHLGSEQKKWDLCLKRKVLSSDTMENRMKHPTQIYFQKHWMKGSFPAEHGMQHKPTAGFQIPEPFVRTTSSCCWWLLWSVSPGRGSCKIRRLGSLSHRPMMFCIFPGKMNEMVGCWSCYIAALIQITSGQPGTEWHQFEAAVLGGAVQWMFHGRCTTRWLFCLTHCKRRQYHLQNLQKLPPWMVSLQTRQSSSHCVGLKGRTDLNGCTRTSC